MGRALHILPRGDTSEAHRTIFTPLESQGFPHSRSFLLLSAAFVLGAGLGMLCAWLVGAEGCGNLKLFFSLYSQIAPDSTCTWSNFLHTLWYFLRLPLLLFLVGFSALGVFVIPAVMLCKGFSFAFAISTLVLLYGPSGLLAAAVFFGVSLRLNGCLAVGGAILVLSLITFFSFRLLLLLLPQYVVA